MDEQTNDQVQAVRQDVKRLKAQLAKILELLTSGRGKSVAGTSSQVEVHLNQCPPKFELNNWEIKKMLKASKGSQK
ncbi:uncharacterized protein E5676_scaffold16G00050 [Cucumis melo var. makuwa]|uniref:Uncharacterized protein n=1 Tax=Cucumis melo var. makuwa TaxID=1194695 RepID=A0A5D3CEE2_CUCMM|nr:uncharacterized protein E6C27_scaffold181G00060 [Cucumis melo var. makuwa]TYK09895.1 uncharacterized protein E5676_scaffold16G00050 [Cucumis melo var. makuwa]